MTLYATYGIMQVQIPSVISMVHHYATSNISETIQDIYTWLLQSDH